MFDVRVPGTGTCFVTSATTPRAVAPENLACGSPMASSSADSADSANVTGPNTPAPGSLFVGGGDQYCDMATCDFGELLDHLRSCPP